MISRVVLMGLISNWTASVDALSVDASAAMAVNAMSRFFISGALCFEGVGSLVFGNLIVAISAIGVPVF